MKFIELVKILSSVILVGFLCNIRTTQIPTEHILKSSRSSNHLNIQSVKRHMMN